MKKSDLRSSPRNSAQRSLIFIASLLASSGLTGCLMVGYSSGGGWFIWPGSLGLLFIILLIVWLLRR